MNRITKLFLFAIIALFLIIGSASANIQNSKLSSLSARKLKAQNVITSTLPSSAAIKSRINRMLKENSNTVNNYGVRKLKQLPSDIPTTIPTDITPFFPKNLPDPTARPAIDPTRPANQIDTCIGKTGGDLVVCRGAQVIRDQRNTPSRATNSPQYKPRPINLKDKCYSVDESENIRGASVCVSDLDCDGLRYCSFPLAGPLSGFCTGTSRPAGTVCPSKGRKLDQESTKTVTAAARDDKWLDQADYDMCKSLEKSADFMDCLQMAKLVQAKTTPVIISS